jgi:hypothetical protein
MARKLVISLVFHVLHIQNSFITFVHSSYSLIFRIQNPLQIAGFLFFNY